MIIYAKKTNITSNTIESALDASNVYEYILQCYHEIRKKLETPTVKLGALKKKGDFGEVNIFTVDCDIFKQKAEMTFFVGKDYIKIEGSLVDHPKVSVLPASRSFNKKAPVVEETKKVFYENKDGSKGMGKVDKYANALVASNEVIKNTIVAAVGNLIEAAQTAMFGGGGKRGRGW